MKPSKRKKTDAILHMTWSSSKQKPVKAWAILTKQEKLICANWSIYCVYRTKAEAIAFREKAKEEIVRPVTITFSD